MVFEVMPLQEVVAAEGGLTSSALEILFGKPSPGMALQGHHLGHKSVHQICLGLGLGQLVVQLLLALADLLQW